MTLPSGSYSPLTKKKIKHFSIHILLQHQFGFARDSATHDGNMSKHIAYPVFYSTAMHRTSRKLNYADNSQTLQKFHTLTCYPVVHCALGPSRGSFWQDWDALWANSVHSWRACWWGSIRSSQPKTMEGPQELTFHFQNDWTHRSETWKNLWFVLSNW